MVGRFVVAWLLLSACSFKAGTADGDDQPTVDAAPDGSPDCWGYAPSNFDPCAQGTIHPPLTLTPGSYTFDPSSGSLTKDGSEIGMLLTTGTGTTPAILSVTDFVIDDGASLQIVGVVPLIIGVHGNAMIGGTISVSAQGASPGPGGGACVAQRGADALAAPPQWSAGGGGAGGAFGSDGAAGGTGDTQPGHLKTPGGAAMAAEGEPLLVPLRGGCTGGGGGEEDPSCTSPGTPGIGGAGGGAIQISARDTMTLGANARVAANGGGGGRGTNGTYVAGSHVGVGGGGGGSGGAILLEGAQQSIATTALLCANGGGGGGGSHNSDGPVTDGLAGACAELAAAGGSGFDADGGSGAFGATAAVVGQPGVRQDDGGGGGGGGVGRIRVRAALGSAPSGFGSTPAAHID